MDGTTPQLQLRKTQGNSVELLLNGQPFPLPVLQFSLEMGSEEDAPRLALLCSVPGEIQVDAPVRVTTVTESAGKPRKQTVSAKLQKWQKELLQRLEEAAAEETEPPLVRFEYPAARKMHGPPDLLDQGLANSLEGMGVPSELFAGRQGKAAADAGATMSQQSQPSLLPATAELKTQAQKLREMTEPPAASADVKSDAGATGEKGQGPVDWWRKLYSPQPQNFFHLSYVQFTAVLGRAVCELHRLQSHLQTLSEEERGKRIHQIETECPYLGCLLLRRLQPPSSPAGAQERLQSEKYDEPGAVFRRELTYLCQHAKKAMAAFENIHVGEREQALRWLEKACPGLPLSMLAQQAREELAQRSSSNERLNNAALEHARGLAGHIKLPVQQQQEVRSEMPTRWWGYNARPLGAAPKSAVDDCKTEQPAPPEANPFSDLPFSAPREGYLPGLQPNPALPQASERTECLKTTASAFPTAASDAPPEFMPAANSAFKSVTPTPAAAPDTVDEAFGRGPQKEEAGTEPCRFSAEEKPTSLRGDKQIPPAPVAQMSASVRASRPRGPASALPSQIFDPHSWRWVDAPGVWGDSSSGGAGDA